MIMIATWLYISTATVVGEVAEAEVRHFVGVSRSRNAALGITGALIWTGQSFAQYLEGPAPGLAELRASICRDWRHRDIETVEEEDALGARKLHDWSLAYSGAASYVERELRRLRPSAGDPGHGAPALKRLLLEFARAG